ncbi:MAG TPA: glycine cleavage system protein H [Anaeromyxobacteraceae bacterium]|nr:glycine cleavage system protein H [Anaeromyxobacteraceae bacterium]
MFGHDFLSNYSAKLIEYALAVAYLVLFVGYWRYVQGGKRVEVPARKWVPQAEPVPVHAGALAPAGWFQVPADLWVHPGHTWARLESDGAVTVGLDDFGHKLIGPVGRVGLPAPGSSLAQGEIAVRLGAEGASVGLISPVEGTVTAVNGAVSSDPERFADAYGRGWLFQVRPPRLEANLKQLFAGEAARRWTEEEGQRLSARMSPDMGQVLQDGGVPIHGIARELEPARWADLVRDFFRS